MQPRLQRRDEEICHEHDASQPAPTTKTTFARKYTPGKRRVSIYWTWSYPWEANRDPAAMENRFSTMTEVRSVRGRATKRRNGARRNFCKESPVRWSCSIGPRLAFSRSSARSPAIRSPCSSASTRPAIKLPIDERVLADTDTLLVFGLDHLLSEQEAAPEEIEAIREWLKREGTCLLLAPHHDVGFTDDSKQRQMEYRHHGDELVPRQQRFSQYTRSLMKALDVPVINQWGLRPAVVKGTKEIAPLTAFRDLDKLGLLEQRHHIQFPPALAAL